jgi:hypothetical protein
MLSILPKRRIFRWPVGGYFSDFHGDVYSVLGFSAGVHEGATADGV